MKAANIITLIRIAMTPVFFILWYVVPNWWLTLIIFLLSSFTDKLDGYVARKYNQVTTFGKFIDPLADKLLICSALLLLVESKSCPAWAAAIIIARELIVTSLRTVAMSKGRVLAADISGKVKMVLQVAGVGVLLCPPVSNISLGIMTLGMAFVWLMTIVTIWSGVDYCIQNRDIIADY